MSDSLSVKLLSLPSSWELLLYVCTPVVKEVMAPGHVAGLSLSHSRTEPTKGYD